MKKTLVMIVILVAVLFFTMLNARAETLAWNAVTTYTDGTSIGTATVTYRAFWSTSSTLSSLAEIGASGSGTTRTFNIDTETMPRGTIIYLTSRAIVGGVESANAAALSWNVPTKAPSAPTNVRMQ
jgi:hypothetical protein